MRVAMLLEELTTEEVAAGLNKTRSVIIPYGVLEAHGPHLPLSTDTIQAYDAA
jgi:creatinine amidohydrolase